jgi:hypothetical protein
VAREVGPTATARPLASAGPALGATPASGGSPADRDEAPPSVVIERIQVITPPAAPPEADLFASLAAIRTAADRRAGER